MFISGLIFFVYACMMLFNYDFMMERYPTFEITKQQFFFLIGLERTNFVAYVGIYIYGFTKVLDRGYFAYAIPVVSTSINMDCYVNAANWWRKLYRSCING